MATSRLRRKRHRVLVEDPHPQSLAALVCMTELYNKEVSKEWLDRREEFLSQFDELFCSYCARGPLLKEVSDPTDKSMLEWLATVDHVVPRDEGGTDDDDNLCVACLPCNQSKRNLSYDEWVKRMKKDDVRNCRDT